jgi:riboflavin synthase
MFTGIVGGQGRVRERGRDGTLVRLGVEAGGLEARLVPGGSVAVNGCCVTVVERTTWGFRADVMPATLERTTLEALAPGDAVNLELPVAAGEPLGGHCVLGHVDGVAEVVEVRERGEDVRVRLRAPEELARYLAVRGSVALDGVSLTVSAVRGPEFEVALVPLTRERTRAGAYRAGSRVNLEVDLLARYVERLLAGARVS